MIEYNGKQYNTREVFVDKHRGHVTIAEVALSDALFPNGTDKKTTKEAEAIDDTIAYYADPDEWVLPEQELRDAIYGPAKPSR